MTLRSSHRELRPFTPLGGNQRLHFELIERNDLLQYSLASTVNAFTSAWHLATSFLGLIPPNSVTDKFPFYRGPSAATAATPVPRSVNWIFTTQQRAAETRAASPPPVSHPPPTPKLALLPPGVIGVVPPHQEIHRVPGVRPAPRSYPRDILTQPGMFVFYNMALAWVLFNIDVRAAGL
jgi:hypothetical protein